MVPITPEATLCGQDQRGSIGLTGPQSTRQFIVGGGQLLPVQDRSQAGQVLVEELF